MAFSFSVSDGQSPAAADDGLAAKPKEAEDAAALLTSGAATSAVNLGLRSP